MRMLILIVALATSACATTGNTGTEGANAVTTSDKGSRSLSGANTDSIATSGSDDGD